MTAHFAGGTGGLGRWAENSEYKGIVHDPAAANWVTLNFHGDYLMGSSPGTGTGVAGASGSFTLGGTANSDLSGTITALGVFRPLWVMRGWV